MWRWLAALTIHGFLRFDTLLINSGPARTLFQSSTVTLILGRKPQSQQGMLIPHREPWLLFKTTTAAYWARQFPKSPTEKDLKQAFQSIFKPAESRRLYGSAKDVATVQSNWSGHGGQDKRRFCNVEVRLTPSHQIHGENVQCWVWWLPCRIVATQSMNSIRRNSTSKVEKLSRHSGLRRRARV